MRICFFNDSLGVGGPEIWAADAARAMAQRGHHVLIGCPSGSWMEQAAESAGLALFDYPYEPEFEHNLRWQLTEAIVEHQIDLICCGIPGGRPAAPLLHRAVREAGRGAVVLRLGVAPGQGALSPQQVGIELDSIRGIQAVSTDIRTRLLALFPSLDADRVQVHYNGVDLERFRTPDPAGATHVRKRLGLPERGPLVACIGRLDPVKNHALLVQAAPRVLDRFPNAAFVVAGDGAHKSDLLQLASNLGVAEKVHFTGFVDDVPGLLAAVDILAHPSRSEGVPNALIEAMAACLPVVATNVGGIPEVVVSEGGSDDTGLLIEPGDAESLALALCRLLKDDALREELGRRGRRRVMEQFDRDACLARLIAWFETMANEGPVGAPADPPALEELPDLYYARGCTLLNPAAN